MSEEGSKAPSRRAFHVEPRSLGADVLRYGLAMTVVAMVGAGVAFQLGRAASSDEASEVDQAVLIDLPAAEASAAPASDAADGPEQHAAQAAVAQQAPERVETPPERLKDRPKDVLKPVDEPVETPPSPAMPNPAAVLERKQEIVPTPLWPVAAPAAQAQEELAPAGAAEPARTDADDEGHPHASKHAITLWQRALLQRLERAKRLADRQPHATGTVKIAFAIDSRGALASESILQSSGSERLDKAALLIVRQAAPFPAPPNGSGDRDTSFVLPIRFR